MVQILSKSLLKLLLGHDGLQFVLVILTIVSELALRCHRVVKIFLLLWLLLIAAVLGNSAAPAVDHDRIERHLGLPVEVVGDLAGFLKVSQASVSMGKDLRRLLKQNVVLVIVFVAEAVLVAWNQV